MISAIGGLTASPPLNTDFVKVEKHLTQHDRDLVSRLEDSWARPFLCGVSMISLCLLGSLTFSHNAMLVSLIGDFKLAFGVNVKDCVSLCLH